MTGMRPTTMPTLTAIWKTITATTPMMMKLPGRSEAGLRVLDQPHENQEVQEETPIAPTKPCSSQKAAKMKSV